MVSKFLKFVFVWLILALPTSSQEVITKDYLMGKFKPAKDGRFIMSGGLYFRRETLDAFRKMQTQAAFSGVNLRIVSAMRTFYQQKLIWEAKWDGRMPVNSDTREFLPKPGIKGSNLTAEQRALRILEFSSMPSVSRHHWGTDLDLNNVNPSHWASIKGQKVYRWLNENAATFGFCQVYSAKRSVGYSEEKWHWSYLPLAAKFTEEYSKQITNSDIANTHFAGAETAKLTHFIENYVLGINNECK